MSFTTLLWLALYLGSIAGAVFSPLLPLVGYLLEYYQRPSLHWWGRDLPDLRWNLTVAIVAAAAYLLHQSRMPPFPRRSRVTLGLMFAIAINTSLVSLWAVAPNLSWRWSEQFWKLIVNFVLFSGVLRTKGAMDAIIATQLVGSAWWGLDGLTARRSSSRLEGVGSQDTLNSNLLAGHLLTIIPLAVITLATHRDKRMRFLALACTPLILNLLILANSRGATLGLLAAGGAALVLVRRGLRRYVALGACCAFVGLFLLADPQFISRQQTTANAQDNSAQSRRDLWAGAVRMIIDRPLGSGGRGFHVLSPRYVPDIQVNEDGMGRSAHNTYLQVGTEWGVQGLALFLGLIGATFVLLHRARAERASPDWVYFTSLGLQLGLIGTLVAAFFSNRFFGESIYWFCGMATALYQMAPSIDAAPAASDGPPPPMVPTVVEARGPMIGTARSERDV